MSKSIQAVRSLIQAAEEASPPPWLEGAHALEVKLDNGWVVLTVNGPDSRERGKERRESFECCSATAKFVIGARNSIPALKELLERLESAEKVIWAVEKQAPIRRSGLINDVLDEFRQRFPKEDA